MIREYFVSSIWDSDDPKDLKGPLMMDLANMIKTKLDGWPLLVKDWKEFDAIKESYLGNISKRTKVFPMLRVRADRNKDTIYVR